MLRGLKNLEMIIFSDRYLFNLDNNQISSLEIPTGNPLIIELNEEFRIIKYEYLDQERAKSLVVF